jgi:hypothetical protein
MMNITQVIEHLEKIRAEHGDINVVLSEPHEYWGSVQHHMNEYDISVSDFAQPDGPKSGKSEKAVVIDSH